MSIASPDSEQREVVEHWRFEQLKEMGFTEPAALELSASTADIRAIERALAKGCGHPLAYKIFR